MSHISEIINHLLVSTVSITIIDGQNEDIITNHLNDEYNPCLLQPIAADKRMNLIFSTDINSFHDWFPLICTDGGDYANEFMFDGAQKWNFKNLIVEDYAINNGTGYHLVRAGSYIGDITCTFCTFTNITTDSSNYHILESYGSFHFHSTKFRGISTNTALIRASHDYHVDDTHFTGTDRGFELINCSFEMIDLSSDDMITFDYSFNEVKFIFYILVYLEQAE